jgi:hypothetical protein
MSSAGSYREFQNTTKSAKTQTSNCKPNRNNKRNEPRSRSNQIDLYRLFGALAVDLLRLLARLTLNKFRVLRCAVECILSSKVLSLIAENNHTFSSGLTPEIINFAIKSKKSNRQTPNHDADVCRCSMCQTFAAARERSRRRRRRGNG